MTTIVFAGPTRVPAHPFEQRGPVAVGDILRLADARRRPARIAIVDGYFEGMAAVWHKEILVALERGIAVYGAASMGALRAAELHPFGMRGVGTIFADFARGALVADDEVAVAHLPAAQHYRPVSDALVNLRAGLAVARRRRILTAATHADLLARARATFYRDRTWAALVAAAPAPARAAMAALPVPDRKAADAAALVKVLRAERAPKRRAAEIESTPRTWALRELRRLLS